MALQAQTKSSNWQTLAPGIEYQDLTYATPTPWSHMHAFRINLAKNHLSLATARSLGYQAASANTYAQATQAFIAINGGFFDNQFRPLGLRIHHRKQINPLKMISWWGIFYVHAGRAHIVPPREFFANSHIDFAIQSGPRLLNHGQILARLKPGIAERTALGITSKGEVIILVTDRAPMSTRELAQRLKAFPLNCKEALNLDGGSSSQLAVRIGSFQLDSHGLSKVSDAVLVKAGRQQAFHDSMKMLAQIFSLQPQNSICQI